MIVMKIDAFDTKILALINEDARKSEAAIARSIKRSKEFVHYRIKRMEKEGLIKEYVTIFNLGYWGNKFLLQLTNVNDEKALLQSIYEDTHSAWITPCSGFWDLQVSVLARDTTEFIRRYKRLFEKIGSHVLSYSMSVTVVSRSFGYSFLHGKKNKLVSGKDLQLYDFDDIDKGICRLLTGNARMSYVDMHKKLKIPIDTIRYRYAKMQKSGIIRQTRVILDASKLGYARYAVFIKAKSSSREMSKAFFAFCEAESRVSYASYNIGNWDYDCTVYVKTSEELRSFILQVREHFGDKLSNVRTTLLFETQKYSFFVE